MPQAEAQKAAVWDSGSSGPIEVIVVLKGEPLAVANAVDDTGKRNKLSPFEQKAHLEAIQANQEAVLNKMNALGGKEVARFSRALNGFALAIDSSKLSELASLPEVEGVYPTVNYEANLSTTVPYVGAAALHKGGLTGEGIVAAVLDFGIDYTHRNLGGRGTFAAYITAYGKSTSDSLNTTRDGRFPTSKVIEGHDFVGEVWPNPDPRCGVDELGNPLVCLIPDPDPIECGPTGIGGPIDCGTGVGHGTSVADILAGSSTDGKHKGVAPGASLLGVKVCSAVANACPNIAILQGIDYALDPDGDGDMSDAADVMNLSLGSSYGRSDSATSLALANAARAGVVVVTAAGNDGDRPYVLGSIAVTPEAITVANTQPPNAAIAAYSPLIITRPPAIAGERRDTATVAWAPIETPVTGDVVYVGRGCAEDEYLADPKGRIALIDRGECNVSFKVDRAARAGAIGVLIGLVAPGGAISFILVDGDIFVPTLVIIQAYANAIRTQLDMDVVVNVTLPASVTLPFVGSMVASSSRGPSLDTNAIKPDIGAPGGSRAAAAGAGTLDRQFSGTSGAAPMVAGAAALLLQAYPDSTPQEIKRRLMNGAFTDVTLDPRLQPGVLAPIMRIGAGELRVDRALTLTTTAWDETTGIASLSYGYFRVPGPISINKVVRVRNDSTATRTYAITRSFRDPADAARGAVTFNIPPSITVPAGGTALFSAQLVITPAPLRDWTINSGSEGGNGPLLTELEFDGRIRLSGDNGEIVELPWQVLPHKGCSTAATPFVVAVPGGPPITFTNTPAAINGRVSVFSLTGESPQIPPGTQPSTIADLRWVGVRPIMIGDPAVPGIQFAVNTFDRPGHRNGPARIRVEVDAILNRFPDSITTLEATSGASIAVIQGQTSGFAIDSDLNSGNVIMTVRLSDLGMVPDQEFFFRVFGHDNRLPASLSVTDTIPWMRYRLNFPHYVLGTGPLGFVGLSVPPGAIGTVSVMPGPPEGLGLMSDQTGILLLYRDNPITREANAITVTRP